MPGYAPDAAFARSRKAFAQIEGWLGGAEAARLEHAALEDQLGARGREVLRLLLQDHLDLRAVREQRHQGVTGPDGAARTRAEAGHTRPLSTVFGPVTVSRIAYPGAGRGQRAPGGRGAEPAAGQAFARAEPQGRVRGGARLVRAGNRGGHWCHGIRLGKRQAQELTRAAAADFEDFYAGRGHRPPPGGAPGDVLVLSCDGKGIVVLPGQMRPETARKAGKKPGPKQDGRLSRGEVRNRKRMAEVGAVFDITPVPRTARDILPPPGPRPGPPPAAPKARHKWVTASVTADAATVVAAVFAEAGRRDPARRRTWIALADGNVHQLGRFRAEAAARNITLTIICDFIHVIEYLWTAAWSFFPEASPEAGPWVRGHAAAILDGRATAVAAAIRAAATTAGLGKTKRQAAERTARYLDAKAPYLNYPQALAAGWPISSGVIEGTCRHLVKDRMDITGARWGTDTAEAVLKLRALHTNGDFDAYWTRHLQREHQRNHGPSRHLAA